jgi:hypothetical protein
VVHSTEPRGFLVPSPGTHPSQLYTSPQPPPPPPLRQSTYPQFNMTAPAPAPAPPYGYAPPPLAPQMSGSISHHSPISDYGPPIPARPPFTGTGTNVSGPRPPQGLTTMPVPNTAASVPYHHGSFPPNHVHPPPSEGSPPNTQSWSYRGCSTSV